MPSDAEIAKYCQQAFEYHNDNWGNSYILSRRFHDDNLKKVLLTTRVLTSRFDRLDNVYVCHTSDSTGLLYDLKMVYGCNITVLTNHPLFERMHEYYDDTLLGIDYKKVDCIFDNPFKYTTDADVVIFPDMEYYVPLNMKEPPVVQHPICCVYYVDDINTATEQNLIDTPTQVRNLFSLNGMTDFVATKTFKDRYCYCGTGTL